LGSTSLEVTPFLKKLRIPFFVLIVAMFAIEWTADLLRALYIVISAPYLIVTVAAGAFSTGLAIFYFVTAVRLSNRIKSSSLKQNGSHKKVSLCLYMDIFNM
jgi:divalent metal cation (Fe/Co/Zn/Cd) transporter